MNAELEERILYVLSALEDANEALDKCDRLMMSKRSEAMVVNQQDKQDDSEQVVHLPKTRQEEEKQVIVSETLRKVQGTEMRGSHGDRKSRQPVLPKELMQKTKAVQTVDSFTTANMLLSLPEKNAQDAKAVAVVRRGRKKDVISSEPDFGKILKKVQTNNEQQWKHVRKFIRNVLLNELEQEKWSRKSTEDLNIRLAKQNQQLRSKLQEKRCERQLLDQRIQAMKVKYKEKSRVLNENQQIVISRCNDTFQKLSKLHEDLDGIQQQFVLDTEAQDMVATGKHVEENMLTKDMEILRVQFNQEALDADLRELIQVFSTSAMATEEKSTREEILKEYYPMIVESRMVMESLLSSIGKRISRLIEMNTRNSIHQFQSWPVATNQNGIMKKPGENYIFEDTIMDEDLLYLFSKEFDAATNFWKAKSYKTFKRLQRKRANCQREA